MKTYILFFCVILSCPLFGKSPIKNLTHFVDPFIGTAYVGHTSPAAQLPFGMVQVGPDTGTDLWEHCSGYYTEDTSIIGFSHTHLSGTGCPDMGDIMLMPVVGDISFYRGDINNTSNGYRSLFSHTTEEASPGYYKVFLDDYKVTVELTATERVAYHRYTYPESKTSGLIIDLAHGIGDKPTETSLSLLNDTTVVGKRRSKGFIDDHTYYFYAVLSKPIKQIKSFEDGFISNKKNIEGEKSKFLLEFNTSKGENVTVKVALSTTGIEGAKRNLIKEIGYQNFNQIKNRATDTWNNFLNKIHIKPINDGQAVSFYTALYHALLMPNLITDVDGFFARPNGTVFKSIYNQYTNFSLWDTYRATHPFYILLFPDINNDFVKSMLQLYKERGLLCTNEYGQNETWCMIGNHAIPVVADAYLKRTISENLRVASKAIYSSLNTEHPKSEWKIYNKYGYYPYDIIEVESVSKTLEHCYDDYCASLIAKLNNDKEEELFFGERAQNYKNLFDDSSQLMRPKDSKGKWKAPFDSFLLSHAGSSGGDYTEGNAWQYTWHVQHNIPELITLMGGEKNFETKLDSLFFLDIVSHGGGFHGDVTGMIGQYAHGNEPSHHVAYLYNYTDSPYKTQEIIRQIFNQFYHPTRDGLSGNDDCGQMSAWYLFSALGFYPIDPVSGEYIIGAPQVHEMTLMLPSGKEFKMVAHHLTEKNKYIKSIKLNGKPLASFAIKYDQIKDGGLLEFEMIDYIN